MYRVMPPATDLHGLDLTSCDEEAIHSPGSIQPHGILLAASRGTLRISAVSTNAARHCGAEVGALLGAPLASAIDAASVRAVAAADADGIGEPLRLARLLLPAGGTGAWRGTLHAGRDGILLEAEPLHPDIGLAALEHFERFQEISRRLMTAPDVATTRQRLVDEMRRLTGYSKIMMYRFAPDWSGEVIAESSDGRLPSYLGLHFPASDIPAQARALYVRNLERQIPDVRYQPVTLVQSTAAPLDLSDVGLRSVSPVHLAYLRNMKVGAAMSYSLLRNGRLWGLIASHHPCALLVRPEVRQSCVMLAQIAMARLGLIEEAAAARRLGAVRAVEARLLRDATEGEDSRDALLPAELLRRHGGAMLDVMGATGAAFRSAGAITCLGDTPPPAVLEHLLDWLTLRGAERPLPEGFATDHLAAHVGGAAELPGAAGLIALPLGGAPGNLAVWFRPEVARSVSWAGEPRKRADDPVAPDRLMPRQSFAAWVVEVRGHSLPWTASDLAAAGHLRDMLATIVMHRSSAIQSRLNAQLQRSNQELESFAYIASHDLKEPLRQIEIFGSLLHRAFGRQGDPPEKIERWFDGITTSSRRLRGLIDHLAEYARVCNDPRGFAPTDLNVLAASVLEMFAATIARLGARIEISPLPRLLCDAIQMRQLFENIMGNALKYHHPSRPLLLRVGAELRDQPGAGWSDDRPIVALRFEDNGIGFDARFCERIFKPFERLHSAEDYEGSGLGLAICRKVVECHGGSIAAHSTPGTGSVFLVTLPACPLPVAEAMPV